MIRHRPALKIVTPLRAGAVSALRWADTTRRVFIAGRLVLLAAAMLAVMLMAYAQRASAQLTEREARAAYLFNFLRFTEFPSGTIEGKSAPLCVMGTHDALGGALASLEGKQVQGRTLNVRMGMSPQTAADCLLVYVPDAELVRLAALREALTGRAVMLVGESEQSLDRGATLAFRSVETRLQFAVNLGAARRVGLKISPQLLRLAVEVRE